MTKEELAEVERSRDDSFGVLMVPEFDSCSDVGLGLFVSFVFHFASVEGFSRIAPTSVKSMREYDRRPTPLFVSPIFSVSPIPSSVTTAAEG